MKDYYLVEIEFKRIQTYLFSVPTLKAMVGANTIIGETIRGCWCSHNSAFRQFVASTERPESQQFDNQFDSENLPDNLPALAMACCSCLPEELILSELSNHYLLAESLEQAKINDKFVHKNSYQDDVLEVAKASGVLVRDGGHFEAVFPSLEKAELFISLTRSLIEKKLPGLIIAARISCLKKKDKDFEAKETSDRKTRADSTSVFDLPQFIDCDESGKEPAVKFEGEKYVGEACLAKNKAAERFRAGKSLDVLGILRGVYTRDGRLKTAEVFDDIGRHANGYMAVLHADGNSVGNRFKALVEKKTPGFFNNWLLRESFFLKVRSGVRIAFTDSLVKFYETGDYSDADFFPAMPLMLGGDDLLIVLAADRAHGFVEILAAKLKETTKGLFKSDGQKAPLSMGFGLLICKDSFPFFKAHSLAEELASSAKKLKRDDKELSLVDWNVMSESWHAGIGPTRFKQCVVKINNEKLILSGKPYVVDGAIDGRPDLKMFLRKARDLQQKRRSDNSGKNLARTQLKYIYERLPEGRFACQLLFDELKHREDLKVMDESGNHQVEYFFEPFHNVTDNCYLTYLGDLIEIMEAEKKGDGDE